MRLYSSISSLHGVNNIWGDMGTTHNAKKTLKLDEIGFKNGFSEIWKIRQIFLKNSSIWTKIDEQIDE